MRVHRDWCFEAFVDVKIPGAGDDLLSSAAGKPRYVQLKRLRVENRCVTTPARKGPAWSHVHALDGEARSFLLLLCTYVFYNLPVSGIGKRK